jgi:NADPH-dependent 2,4-dienoyl-CoA reductase/sulfur reductase-like enzyme
MNKTGTDGGVRSEFTITRIAPDRFYVISAGAAERFDWDFLWKNLPADGTVRLSDGTEVAPDAIVVGIGAVPDDTLARAAGLACDHGILVDDSLRCSDPHVFAAGDVANHQHPALGRRIRVEHWDTAIHQGRPKGAHERLARPASHATPLTPGSALQRTEPIGVPSSGAGPERSPSR